MYKSTRGSHLIVFFGWKMNQYDGEIPNISSMRELFIKYLFIKYLCIHYLFIKFIIY